MSERLRTNEQWIRLKGGSVIRASVVVWAHMNDGRLFLDGSANNNGVPLTVHPDDVAEAMRILGLEFHADTKEQTT